MGGLNAGGERGNTEGGKRSGERMESNIQAKRKNPGRWEAFCNEKPLRTRKQRGRKRGTAKKGRNVS